MTVNQELSGSNLAMAIGENSCAVGHCTLHKVFLDNDHLLYLDYEYDNGAYNMLNIVKVPFKYSNLPLTLPLF